mgnify:CR=1 FL=1
MRARAPDGLLKRSVALGQVSYAFVARIRYLTRTSLAKRKTHQPKDCMPAVGAQIDGDVVLYGECMLFLVSHL